MAVDTLKAKSRHDINLMRSAGQIVGEAILAVAESAKPGISTWELDEVAETYIRQSGAIPTFKGYWGPASYPFPASVCLSINDEVVHGLPSKTKFLKEGDILSIDCGATYRGMVADSARTIAIGAIKPEVAQLLDATRESLYAAIEKMSPGHYLEDVSGAVEDVCLKYGYGLVRQYGGHGVGYKLHEDPFLFNYRTGVRGPQLRSGIALAIEPMFNLGSDDVFTADDEWTVITIDHLPSAHFEHTVVVTDHGPDILTEIRSS